MLLEVADALRLLSPRYKNMLEAYRTGADKLIERTKDDPEWVELGKLSNKQNRSEKENERYWALSDSVFNKIGASIEICNALAPRILARSYLLKVSLFTGVIF